MRALAVCLLLLALEESALANGLTTHVWITLKAREHVPDGELGELVRDPALADVLVSGTIFPDGGYAVGDGYGELAHWEPFQLTYLAWIREQYAPPWSAEAKGHIAFLLGMASHGMADQVFDSMYLARARRYDAESDWEEHSVDEATDVAFAADAGGQKVPMRFLPREVIAETFLEAHGHAVDLETLKRGQSLAGFAVAAVEILADDPEAVAEYREQFPWATGHMLDESVPGNPQHEAELVALYWRRIWDRLHGRLAPDDFVLGTRPADGSHGHEVSASSIESRFSIVFARRLAERDLSPAQFALEDASGVPVPFDVDLFYGDDSHVVHLIPTEDLLEDRDYSIAIRAGLTSREGDRLPEDVRFSVSTADPPVPEERGCSGVEGERGGALVLVALALLAIRKKLA